MFNDGRYWEKVQRGQLGAFVVQDRHPSLPLAKEPFCTRSQIVAYHEPGGKLIAKVHQYLRKDQTIGASGKPDPKTLLVGETLYLLKKP